MDDIQYLNAHLREVSDFPEPGINFYDVSTLFKDSHCLDIMVQKVYDLYKDKKITKVIGIESRGFILGSILAHKLNAGFVMCRKPNKLPAETLSETYEKEYGTDSIEMHIDSLNEDDVVLIHDDVLATGGTLLAAYNLVKKFNIRETYINVLIELEFLHGKSNFNDVEITSLIQK